MDLQEVWVVLQEKICRRCIDGDGTGACRLPAGEECALRAYLPNIVTAIGRTPNGSLDMYVKALRDDVCSMCLHGETQGTCTKRKDLECALDRYYPLVIEIVETVSDMMRTNASSTGFVEGRRS